MANTNKKAMLVGVGVVAAAGLAGSAFAASISSTGSNAGQGSVTVSGYSVTSAVTYNGGWTNTASGDGGTTVTSFSFTLTKAGGGAIASSDTTVYAQLVTAGTDGNWTACTVGASNAVTCTPTGTAVELSAVTNVNIVAYAK